MPGRGRPPSHTARAFAAVAFILVLRSVSVASDVSYLSGELTGEHGPGVFVVSGSLYVPPGRKVVFRAGSILRFELYTGIIVRGRLECNGTAEKPVILTSVKDGAFMENNGAVGQAFDWNGVKCTDEALSLRMTHCRVRYSTYGIEVKSRKTAAQLRDVVFHENGMANLKRAGELIPVAPGTPENHTWGQETHTETSAAKVPVNPSGAERGPSVREEGVPEEDAPEKRAQPAPRRKKWVLVAPFAAATFGGTVMWLAGRGAAHRHQRDYLSLESPDEVLRARQRRDRAITVRNVGVGVTIGGGLGAAVSFFLGRDR